MYIPKVQVRCIVAGLSPVAPIVDVRAIGHFIDTFAFAVAWGKTNVEVIRCALMEAGNVSSRLPGGVFD